MQRQLGKRKRDDYPDDVELLRDIKKRRQEAIARRKPDYLPLSLTAPYHLNRPKIPLGLQTNSAMVIAGEKKYFDCKFPFAANNADANWLIKWPLCADGTPGSGAGIITGTAKNNRVGSRIFVTNLNIKFRLGNTALTAAAAEGSMIRLVVGIDMQANGAMPVAGDVWVADGNILENRNLDQSQRFRILMDKFVCIPVTAADVTNGTYPNYRVVEKYFKFKQPLQIAYSDVTGVIAEVKAVNLFVMACAYANDRGSWGFTSRIRYYDN